MTRKDHSYLRPEDECFFFGDYTARKGFAHSPTNSVITNFKRPLVHRNTASWTYKVSAIDEIVRAFSANIGKALGKLTLVPTPPSKLKSHPE